MPIFSVWKSKQSTGLLMSALIGVKLVTLCKMTKIKTRVSSQTLVMISILHIQAHWIESLKPMVKTQEWPYLFSIWSFYQFFCPCLSSKYGHFVEAFSISYVFVHKWPNIFFLCSWEYNHLPEIDLNSVLFLSFEDMKGKISANFATIAFTENIQRLIIRTFFVQVLPAKKEILSHKMPQALENFILCLCSHTFRVSLKLKKLYRTGK